MTTNIVPLESDETVLWSGRPRLKTVLPSVAAGLLLIAAPIAAAVVTDEPLLGLLAPLGLSLPIWTYLTVTHTAFLVTDRALYRKTGILSRSVQRIGLDRVQNSSYRQGLTGTLFGYGTVDVEAAGGGQLSFHNVETPRDVRALVDRRAGERDVPGSPDQWEAVLAEVRALKFAIVDE